MSSFVKITLHVPDSAATMTSVLNLKVVGNSISEQALQNLMASVVEGAQIAYAKISTGALQAAGSVTFTGRPTADETLTIANVTLTAKDTGANGTTQFNTSGSDVAVTAASLAACVNANTTLNKIVSATSLAGVVTLTAVNPGVAGNGLDLTESMTNTTKSAFASGSDGSQIVTNYGAAS